MMDYNKARFNMVEQQIRPWDVLDFDLLDTLADIPREVFVQEEQRGYAYCDAPLVLPNGYMMLEPKIIARMVQGLGLKKTDSVLEVGTGSGYATAVLAALSAEVDTCDTDEVQLASAATILDSLKIGNVHYRHGDGLAARTHNRQYDAVYIGGSLPEVPESLKGSLKDGGRMVVVVGEKPVQRCLQITREGENFRQKVLFDTLVAGLGEKSLPKGGSKFVF